MRFPEEIMIEVTPYCNLGCSFCMNRNSFAKGNRALPEPSAETVKRWIDSISDTGIEAVRFTGGEPLLRKDIVGILAYAKSKGIYVMLNTNAILVDENNAEDIKRHADNILVSIISHDPEKEKQITRSDSFFKRIRGIRLLSGARRLRFDTVASPQNIADAEQLFSFVKGLGVKEWEWSRQLPLEKKEAITGEEARSLVDKLWKFNHQGIRAFISTGFPFCASDPSKTRLVCTGSRYIDGHIRFVIDPRGFCKPSYPDDINIGTPDDLLSCWNHPFMRKMRDGGYLPAACRACTHRKVCMGGSRYIANLVNGAYDAPDPLMGSL